MTRILVAGSVNLDITARVPRLPVPGETVSGATLERGPGGKGGNQALAARRLGAEVTLIAAVGSDPAADLALALLRDAGVCLDYCRADPEAATGTAIVCVAPSGENQIVVAPGANARLTVPTASLPPADALIAQLEVPAQTLAGVMAGFDGLVAINLAPARPVDPELIRRADLVVVNATEADWYGAQLQLCGGRVATTLGPAGARLLKRGAVIAEATAPRVVAVDTTGAGDAFTAALTVALVEGMPEGAALRFACAAGALAATRHGAQAGMPTRAAVEALLGSRN